MQNWALAYFFTLGIVFLFDLYNITLYNNNLRFLIIYSIVEVIFYTFLFQVILFSKVNYYFLILSCLSLAFGLIELISLNFSDIDGFQSYSRIFSNMIIATFAAYNFILLLKNIDFRVWKHFGLNSIILIYFSIQSIMFLPFNYYLILSDNAFNIVIIINYLTNFAFYILLIYFIYVPVFTEIRKSQIDKKNKQQIDDRMV